MKRYSLKHESALRICAEIAELIGVESLTISQCYTHLQDIERAATAGETPTSEIRQHQTVSKRPEHVRAYADDFDIIELSDEDLGYGVDVDGPEYDEPYAGGAN